MIHDIIYAVYWWFILFIFSLPAIFAREKILSNLADQGYAIKKIVGLAIVSIIVWTISSYRIMPFSQGLIILVLLIITITSFLGSKKSKFKINKIGLLEEFLFLAGLVFWVTIRGFNPDILGLEKFMDMSLVNVILKSNYFPPADPWLSGNQVNYYYFGHFVTALLTKFSQLPSNITYNLMVASIFGLSFSGIFSLSFNLISVVKNGDKKFLRKTIFLSILAGLLLTLGSNLHPIYALTKGYQISDDNHLVKPPWELLGKPNPQAYWYPSAARMIPYSIHEFPAYSFIVSDLHAHFLDIPFVLASLTLILSIFISFHEQKQKSSINIWKSNLIPIILLGVVLSTNYMANSLDGAIYFLIYIILLIVGVRQLKISTSNKIYTFFLFTLMPTLLIVVLTAPFTINFVPFVSGIGINCASGILNFIHKDSLKIGPIILEQDKCLKSPLYMLWILWSLPFFSTLIYFFNLVKNKINITIADKFIIISSLVSFLLIIFPEFFYFKDIYTLHFRANTMFKLGYQSFIMLTIAICFQFSRISIKSRFKRIIILSFLYFQTLIMLSYPTFSTGSYYQSLNTYRGIDGAKFIDRDDWNAIEWLRKNSKPGQIVVEAVGESYSGFAKISAFSGVPTIIGWPGHEWGWRQSGVEPYKRKSEVEKFYNSEDLQLSKRFLENYNVDYVFVGSLERENYSIDETILEKLGTLVFESNESKIYKRKSG